MTYRNGFTLIEVLFLIATLGGLTFEIARYTNMKNQLLNDINAENEVLEIKEEVFQILYTQSTLSCKQNLKNIVLDGTGAASVQPINNFCARYSSNNNSYSCTQISNVDSSLFNTKFKYHSFSSLGILIDNEYLDYRYITQNINETLARAKVKLIIKQKNNNYSKTLEFPIFVYGSLNNNNLTISDCKWPILNSTQHYMPFDYDRLINGTAKKTIESKIGQCNNYTLNTTLPSYISQRGEFGHICTPKEHYKIYNQNDSLVLYKNYALYKKPTSFTASIGGLDFQALPPFIIPMLDDANTYPSNKYGIYVRPISETNYRVATSNPEYKYVNIVTSSINQPLAPKYNNVGNTYLLFIQKVDSNKEIRLRCCLP